jgi:glutamate-5-semialdehyde dehydrogenase
MADIEEIGKRARLAGQELAGSSSDARNAALGAIKSALVARTGDILAANAEDLKVATATGLDQAVYKVRRWR